MSGYNFNLRIIKFVADDILLLYEKFGYETFTLRDAKDIPLRYSLKRLLNEAVVIEHGTKTNGRINYKLSKFVVDKCKNFAEPKYIDRKKSNTDV